MRERSECVCVNPHPSTEVTHTLSAPRSPVAPAALASASDVHRGRSWAILVAGSNGYGNLRHQADVAHAYQVLRAAGVGASRIITMMYDDVATDPANPFPGQLFNHPTGDRPGRDVYAGVHIDYTGGDVTAAHFLAVLTGNASGVPAGKPVLRSGKDDTLFVYYSDHGAAGLVAMPTGPYLYANDLSAALKAASSAGLFRKAVLYIEACESGSMCANGLMSDDSGIYCETAAGTDESSWGTFCPPDDIVNGTHVGSCLGDLYSVNFIENSEQRRPFGSARLTCGAAGGQTGATHTHSHRQSRHSSVACLPTPAPPSSQ